MAEALVNRGDYAISNIKISCIIAIKDTKLLLLNSDDKGVKHFGNFAVVRRNNFVYSIFKKREKSAGEKNNNTVLYHINITKIPSSDQIASSIDNLKNIIENEYFVVAKQINNLTCTYDTGLSSISLLGLIEKVKEKVPSVKRVRFSPERFPGMFISFPNNTLLIFSSGKMVVIGGKSELANLQSIGEMVNFLNNQRQEEKGEHINDDR